MFRWSAVFAGATVAVTLWVLLQMIGMGIGLATVDVGDAGSLRTVGIGTTVWTAVTPLIALFIGGLVAGRLAATYSQRSGALHGFVLGAFASLLGLFVMLSVVSTVANAELQGRTSAMIDRSNTELAPALRDEERQKAADAAGKILFGVGVTLLLSIGAAIAGGGIAARRYGRKYRTEEVPAVPPPAAPPPANEVEHAP